MVSKNILRKLNSIDFLRKLIDFISLKVSLEIIKYNKNLQKNLNININNYKEYSEIYSSIEVEIIPLKIKYGKFININKENEKYFYIYFNNNKEKEIRETYLRKDNKVSKINIIIDYQISSFYRLFYKCNCIESICFKTFYRNNINNMESMFEGCSALNEINLSNFNTDNVNDLFGMFCGCSSLEDLNLSKFNTKNVIDMSEIFRGCKSLKELNLSNFIINKTTDMNLMFDGCSDELKLKIRNKHNNFKEETFQNYYEEY